MKKTGKIVWLVYALIGSFLILWDVTARGEHILLSLLAYAYCLPSSLLTIPLASVVTTSVQRVLMWILMIALNGWLIYRLSCLFTRRSNAPNQSPQPTRPTGG